MRQKRERLNELLSKNPEDLTKGEIEFLMSRPGNLLPEGERLLKNLRKKKKASPAPPPPADPDGNDEDNDYDEMSVAELRDEIDRRNEGRDEDDRIHVTGTKADLIDRLIEDDEQDEE